MNHADLPDIVRIHDFGDVTPGMMAISRYDMWLPPVQVVAVHRHPPSVDVVSADEQYMRGQRPEVYLFFTEL